MAAVGPGPEAATTRRLMGLAPPSTRQETGKKQAAEIGFWSNFSDEEVMRSMIEDQSIMEELQLLN